MYRHTPDKVKAAVAGGGGGGGGWRGRPAAGGGGGGGGPSLAVQDLSSMELKQMRGEDN